VINNVLFAVLDLKNDKHHSRVMFFMDDGAIFATYDGGATFVREYSPFDTAPMEVVRLEDGQLICIFEDKIISIGTVEMVSVVPATRNSIGGIIIGDNLLSDATGKTSVPVGSSIVKGVLQVDGVSITESDGVISGISYTVPPASETDLGGVKFFRTTAYLFQGNWLSDGRQIVPMEGIKASYNPIVDVLSDVPDGEKILSEFSKLGRIATSDGYITCRCYGDLPSIDLEIQLLLTRTMD
jgi:hypothetical protein